VLKHRNNFSLVFYRRASEKPLQGCAIGIISGIKIALFWVLHLMVWFILTDISEKPDDGGSKLL
jgi:hypothetical protein